MKKLWIKSLSGVIGTHVIFPKLSFAAATALGSISIALFFLSIRLILGQESFITIHDNLDSDLPNRFAMANSTNANTVLQIMNGLPASFMTSRLNLVYLLFELFDPFTAYIINEAFVHAIAFAGMALLLHWHFRQYLSDKNLLVFGVALCFSLLPFYSIYGLSIAGQPLLLACFLNLQNRRRIQFSIIFIILFCFASALVLTGVFLIISGGIWFVWNTYRNKQINYYLLSGLALLVVCYGISEFKLIKLMLMHEEISHREARSLALLSKPIDKAITSAIIDFIIGQYHVASQHAPILGISAFTLIIAWRNKLHTFLKPLFWLLACLGIIALFYGFFPWDALIPYKEKFLLLKTFDISRFYTLQPLLWYLTLALCLGTISIHFQNRKLILLIFILQLGFIVGSNLKAENELRVNLHLIASRFTKEKPNVITYKAFLSETLFHQVEATIGKPQASYRVACLGIYPGMAQLNGFYTLDSYQSLYPLCYKNNFREIIAPELDKNEKLRSYFDGWGSRCYIFTSETEKNPLDNEKITSLDNFQLNNAAMKKLGGQYLISAYFLKNSPANNLKLIQKFQHADAMRPLYLYKVL